MTVRLFNLPTQPHAQKVPDRIADVLTYNYSFTQESIPAVTITDCTLLRLYPSVLVVITRIQIFLGIDTSPIRNAFCPRQMLYEIPYSESDKVIADSI